MINLIVSYGDFDRIFAVALFLNTIFFELKESTTENSESSVVNL